MADFSAPYRLTLWPARPISATSPVQSGCGQYPGGGGPPPRPPPLPSRARAADVAVYPDQHERRGSPRGSLTMNGQGGPSDPATAGQVPASVVGRRLKP